MNEWDELLSGDIDALELIDKEAPQLTREDKRATFKRSRLLHFLDRGHWTLKEAAHLVAGLDPEHSIAEAWRADGIKLRCLPGLKMPQDQEGRRNFCTECEEAVQIAEQRLAGISEISALSVSALIEKALAMGLEPPWLEYAKDDRHLAARLSQKTLGYGRNAPALTSQEVAREGGLARAQRLQANLNAFIGDFLCRDHSAEEVAKFCFRNGKISIRKVAAAICADDDMPLNEYRNKAFEPERSNGV